MKKMTYQTTVHLKELTEDADSYSFSRETGELNSALSDLIGNHPYVANLHLRSLGNVFEIAGEIKTSMDLLCSHCGRDLTLPIDDKFAEIIIVMSELPKGGHNGHTGQILDQGPACNYATSYSYDLADFVHEHIALAEPVQPLCTRADCDEVFASLNITPAPSDTQIRHNPFATLKELDLKKSN